MLSKLICIPTRLRGLGVVCVVASVLSLAVVPECCAQFGTGGTGGGTGGGFGGTGGGGGGGFGGGGGGGGGQGAGNFGAGGTGVVQPEVINIGGETRYIRDQRPAGSFVGADSSDYYRSGQTGGLGGGGAARGLANQQTALGGQGPRGTAAQGGLGGVGGIGGQGQGQGANSTILRRNYRIGFEYPAVPANQVATINRRVEQLDSIRGLQQRSGRSTGGLGRVQVSRQNGRVVLTGSVPTMEDRVLAERLVRLEPDVFQIQNELTVEGMSPEEFQSVQLAEEFPPDEGGYRELPLEEESTLPTPEPTSTQDASQPEFPDAPLQLVP